MENKLRESQLVFLGKLLAGYTHELKNHLAIINESSGLMDDLLMMSEEGDEKLHLRFRKIIVTIGERISAANIMAMYLNRIAHRMDSPLSHCNVNDLLTEELALMERFGAMKNISFDKNLQKEIPSVYNNPSLLQFIIFSLVNDLMERLTSGSVIRFSSSARGDDVVLHIESVGPFDSDGGAVDSGLMVQILDFAAEKADISLSQNVSSGAGLNNILTISSKMMAS